MSEEQQVGTGSHSNFLWENNIIQPWVLISNSDNSGGSDEKSGKKLLHSSSNSPTPNAAVTPPAVGQKRGRNGVPKGGKTGGGSSTDWNINEGKGGGGGGESDHEIHIWTERERRKKMRNMFSSLHALLPQLPPKADKSTIVDEAVNYIKTLQHSLEKLQKQKLETLRGTTTTTTTTASIDYDEQPSAIVASSTISGFNSREAFLADQAAAAPSSRINNNNNTNNMMMMMMITNNMNNSSSPPPQCSLSNNIPLPPPPPPSPRPACIINNPSAASLQTWSSPNVVLCVNGEDAQISVCSPRKPGLFSTVCYVLEKHKLEVVTAHVSSDYYRSMYMIHAHASGAACEQFPEPLPVEEIYKLAVGEIIFWLSSS